jgi:RNA polymerase sigma-70 factor (ECF subfamily)
VVPGAGFWEPEPGLAPTQSRENVAAPGDAPGQKRDRPGLPDPLAQYCKPEATCVRAIMMPPRFRPSFHRRGSDGEAVLGRFPVGGKVGLVVTLEIDDVRARSWTEVARLVQRAQNGDRDALSRLVEQFQPTVTAIALRRLGNASEALELTQEVFLHVLRRIHQLREPERFAGWLRQVAVRMAINRATRRVPPQTVDAGLLEGAYEQADQPVDELIARERAERLWEALGRLKPLDRDTLVAFYIRGLTLVDMAEEVEAPLGTIKRRLHTARKRLRLELESCVADAREWSDGFAVHSTEDEEDEDAVALDYMGAGAPAAQW